MKRKKTVTTYWIFCEGEKTEKNYFNKLKFEKRISGLNVKPCKFTDALGMVKHSIKFKNGPDFMEGDFIYCIFDRNGNTEKQLSEAEKLADKNDIRIIFSNPCFEYWVLCHFECLRFGSEKDEINSKLEKYIDGYEKTDKDIYSKISGKTNDAIENAKKVHFEKMKKGIKEISRESNPFTNVYELICKFLRI